MNRNNSCKPTHFVVASRLWFADRPDSKLYVSDIPRKGSNGRYGDWEYSNSRDKAVLLDITWARRFVTDCLEVGAPVTLEPFPDPSRYETGEAPGVVDDRQTKMFEVEPPDCLCAHAIKDWDGVTHDKRCSLYSPDLEVVEEKNPNDQAQD